MLDALYVLGSLAFFATMLGYVVACAALGRPASDSESDASAERMT